MESLLNGLIIAWDASANWEVSMRSKRGKGVRPWNKSPNLEVTDRYQQTQQTQTLSTAEGSSCVTCWLQLPSFLLDLPQPKLWLGTHLTQQLSAPRTSKTTPFFLLMFSGSVSFWTWTKSLPYQYKGKCPTEHKPRAFYCDTAFISLKQQRRSGAAVKVHSHCTALSIH